MRYPLTDSIDGQLFQLDEELVVGRAENKTLSEQEIAIVLQRYLESTGHETYPEVKLKYFSGRPDLIATRGIVCSVYECKTNLTFGLVAQAAAWPRSKDRRYGVPHLVWIVIGSRPETSRTSFAEEGLLWDLVRTHRLGVIEVRKKPRVIHGNGEWQTKVEVSYTLHLKRYAQIQPGSRKTAHLLAESLNPDTRVAVPGSRGGKTVFMTDFKRTTIKMARLMGDEQPRTLKEIVLGLANYGGHHYESDNSALSALRPYLADLGYRKLEGTPAKFQLRAETAENFLARHREGG